MEMSSSSMLLASASQNIIPNNVLSLQQRAFIMECVAMCDRRPCLYFNVSGFEHQRLSEEMDNSPVGTILEAFASLSEALTYADRRTFWVKTVEGIFQVSTNRQVNALQQVVFNP